MTNSISNVLQKTCASTIEKEDNQEEIKILETQKEIVITKYQREIDKTIKLENKALGFFTIFGVFFAANLVLLPVVMQTLMKFNLGIICIVIFLIELGISIFMISNVRDALKLKTTHPANQIPLFDIFNESGDYVLFLNRVIEDTIGDYKEALENNNKLKDKVQKIAKENWIFDSLILIEFTLYFIFEIAK